MTPAEFSTLQQDWRVRWPAVDSWLGGLLLRTETLQSWYDETFCHLELRDCLTATGAVVGGDLEGPLGFSVLPGWYERHARRISWERQQKERRAQADHQPYERSHHGGSCRKAMAKAESIIREEIAAGGSREDAIAMKSGPRAHEWEEELT